MTVPKDLAALARSTGAVYERNAERYDRDRSRTLFEQGWLDRFLALVPRGGPVLDLGCGTGDPIAAYISGMGYRVTGLDRSEAMLTRARTRYPEGDWRSGDMRRFDLPDRFDGILGWNSFFHLTGAEQRATLPRIARHLTPGGALMLTVGPEEGEVAGRVGEDPVYHASLSPAEYAAMLTGLGLSVVAFVPEDPDCNGHSVLLARRQARGAD